MPESEPKVEPEVKPTRVVVEKVWECSVCKTEQPRGQPCQKCDRTLLEG